ncbi:MAG: hypothetical protein HQ568_07275, partial [Calditrichaeota bacterium]|nr:hypothetical protein [Calditrichota bacterium]
MSNHHLILSILLVSACLLYAQPDAPYEPDPITVGLWHMDNAEPESLWTITIGDENEVTNLGSVIETGDGAYFICGSSTVDTIQSMLLMEMDEDGETIWSRGYSGLSSFVDLVVVGDTSLAILCVGDEINDFYILITDLNGDSLTYYADSLEEEGWFSDIEITDDGGFLLVGTCYDGNFNFEMWVVKLDSSGEVEWSTTYDCGEAEVSSCDGILRTSGGNYLIYGRSDLSGYMLEIDPDGEINWARRYGDGISCRICSVIQNEDLYYCTGDRFDRLANSWHYLLFSVDENGNLQAGSMFGTNNSNEIGKSIMMSSDDKIIIAGIDRYLIDDREYFRYGGNMGLVKTGTERGFEFIWYKAYGDDSHEEAHQVFQCPDNSYLLFGTTTDDEQNSRIRIIKTTPDLDIGADVSGNMNRGELNGDAVQTDNGRWGEALDLTNESSGCMLVENDSSLQTDILTVECWFRMTDDIPQIGALVNKVLAEDFASYALFASNASDEVVFLIGTEAHEFVVEYETEPDDNRWHH